MMLNPKYQKATHNEYTFRRKAMGCLCSPAPFTAQRRIAQGVGVCEMILIPIATECAPPRIPTHLHYRSVILSTIFTVPEYQ
jgi:hypothetical protein